VAYLIYSYEEKSRCDIALSESKDRYKETANEIAEQIKMRFPFVDIVIRDLGTLEEEMGEFFPYGLFEIQIIAHQGARSGILYSKKIAKILPDYHKILEEICNSFFNFMKQIDFFVDKTHIEIEIYDILRAAHVLTPSGLANKNIFAKYLEGT
jgi:hypothetical protein